MDYLYFLFYKLFRFSVLLLPKPITKLLLDSMAFLAYTFGFKHKKIAKANLDFVYEDRISEDEKYAIIKKSYNNLLYNLFEFIENQTLDLEGFNKKIKVENEHFMQDAIDQKRKIVLITAHYGNWELGSSFIPVKYGSTTIVGRLLNNKYLNEDLLKARNNHNATMLSTKEAGKGLIKALKKGDIVGLVIDQHNTAGLPVQFLGHKVKLIDSTARLSSKYNAIILPVFFTMDSFGEYTAKFYEPLEPSDFEGKNQMERLTQKQADIMSEHILSNPSQWFWQHKRFKFFHREIYES